jgi:hypothetical protein
MVESSRLEDLRPRVQKDPASIAFAQLAEAWRRANTAHADRSLPLKVAPENLDVVHEPRVSAIHVARA